MGCCGCTLYATVITAFLFTLVECLYGIAWNILIIMVLRLDSLNSTLQENHVTEFLIDTYKDTERNGPIPGILITALILNALWLISAISLLWGNVHSSRHHMRPWIIGTVIIMATDIAATVYFFVRSGQDGSLSEPNVDDLTIKELFRDRFFFTAILFCRGGIVMWVINIAFIVFVCQRMTEIGIVKTSHVIDTLRKKTRMENTYEMSDMKGSLRNQRDGTLPTNGKHGYDIPPVDYEHIDPRGRTYEDHESRSQLSLTRNGITNASKWTYLPGGANLNMARSEIRRPPTPDYDEEPNNEAYSRRVEQAKNKEYIKPYPRQLKNAAYENRGFEREGDNSKDIHPERSIPRVKY